MYILIQDLCEQGTRSFTVDVYRFVNPKHMGVKYPSVILRGGELSHVSVMPYLLVKKQEEKNLIESLFDI